MENSLSRSYSSLRFENEPHQGCMWGIFHMLHFYQRHNVKKKHTSKRHGGQRRSGGVKYSRLKENALDTSDQQAFIKEEMENLKVDDDMPSTIPTFNECGKAFTENINAEENKHQLPSFPSRFQRIHSIHHLEPSHHHLPDEVREDDEESAKFNHHQVDCPPVTRTSDSILPKLSEKPVASCKQRELNDYLSSAKSLRYDQLNALGRELLDEALLQDKLGKSKEALLQQKHFDLKEKNKDATLYQSTEFSNSLEVLDVNQSFLKILEDPNYSLAHHIQALQASKAKRGLTKSGSYPVSESSRIMDIEPGKRKENRVLAKQEGKVKSGNLQSLSIQVKSSKDSASSIREAEKVSSEAHEIIASSFRGPFDQLKKQGENQAGTKRFKTIKQMIKYAIKESKKGRRISMDAILHKIPYGRSFSKNSKREINDQWRDYLMDNDGKDSPRAKYENDSPVSTPRKGGQSRMRRAHSLNDSLDKYSQLFKSSFGHDKNWCPSDKLLFSQSPKALGRIHSLPSLESHGFLQNEAPFNARCSDTPTTTPLDHGTDIERSSFSEQKSVGLSLASTENVTELDALLKSESSTIEGALVESISETNCHENAEFDDTNYVENGESSCISQHEQEPESTNNRSTKLPQPSPISVLEFYFQDDVISPAKFSISGLKLEPRCIDFDDQDEEEANQQDQSIIDSPRESAITVDLEKMKNASMHLAGDFLHVQVDRKDEADFNYVRAVLELSRFSGNGYLGTWHSPDEPVDPSLFEEVETCSPPKSGVTEDEKCSSSHDRQLLFDIINEVLLEIYNRSFSYWLQRLSCNCHIRPMPKGYHVLEEVWSCIRWYLSSQSELDPSMDYIVGRDISKNDGWMNLQFDSECVGLELEEMIWDDLLEEVIRT